MAWSSRCRGEFDTTHFRAKPFFRSSVPAQHGEFHDRYRGVGRWLGELANELGTKTCQPAAAMVVKSKKDYHSAWFGAGHVAARRRR